MLSKDLFNCVVRFKGNSLSIDFTIPSLKDKFSNGFPGRISVGDIGFDSSKHIDGGFIDSNENSVVELSQSEESHYSDDFGVEFVNTSDSYDKGKSGFGGYVDLSSEFGLNNLICTFLLASISARVAFW